MHSVKTKQMKYTAEAKLIMPVNKCKIIEKFDDCNYHDGTPFYTVSDCNGRKKSVFESHCPELYNLTCNGGTSVATTAPTISPYYNPADTNPNCMNATAQQCFDVTYQSNCQNTCANIFNNSTSQPTQSCVDEYEICSNYTTQDCNGPYATRIQSACPRTCGLCSQ